MIFWVLLNSMDKEYSKKVTGRLILWSVAFAVSSMGGTQVDDLLDVESQKRFTTISIISYLASL